MEKRIVFNYLVMLSLSFTVGVSCSSKQKVQEEKSVKASESVGEGQKIIEPQSAPSVEASVPPVQSKIEPVQLESTQKAMESLAHGTKPNEVDVHLVAPTHQHAQGVDAEKSMGWLKNGNARYTKGRLRADGQSTKDRSRLLSGQKPHAIILSCSDSRVPPEIVFDQKLGEIFVVRTAGESLEPTSIASIEYALEHLGSRLIVVMGHTSCGAVKAALGTPVGGDAGSPNLNKLVADIQPRLQSFMGKEHASDVEGESWANAKGVAKDLMARSKIISDRVKSGDVKIVSSLYYLDSGKVIFE